MGQSYYELSPNLPQRSRDLHRRALAGETLLGNEDRVAGPDGSTRWIRWAIHPWRDARGEIGGVIIVVEDETAKVEAERALRKENLALAAEIKAMMRFYNASLILSQVKSVQEGLDEALAATIDVLGADMGNIQLLSSGENFLRIVADQGFDQEFLDRFRAVCPEEGTSCGRAFRTGAVVVIEDIELDEGLAPYRAIVRDAGFRAVVSAPLINRRGEVLGILSAHFRSPHRPSDGELRWLDLYWRRATDFLERFRHDQALRESEEHFRLAVAGSRMAMYDRDVITGIYRWDDECYRLLGYEVGEVVPSHDAWFARVHPEDRKVLLEASGQARREHRDFSTEYRVLLPGGGMRWVRSRGRYVYEDDEPVRVIGLAEDTTESRQQIETQRVLVAELQHRTRNLMALVQSIAHQTLSTATSLEDFEKRFDQRLEALSRVQSLLSRADSEPITLDALIGMELQAIGSNALGDRVAYGGPEVPLRKSTVETLALALHELATNALKYGALASERGRLSVTWEITGVAPERRLVLDWVEHGITAPPPTADPARRGFGRVLIEQGLPYSLSAETKFALSNDSLHCRISLPLATSKTDEVVN
jgi:PAS domain S-box-containing protein